ncbi:MAG: AmmeMemoRadiSam system protein B [Elusimicrobiota bacterium]
MHTKKYIRTALTVLTFLVLTASQGCTENLPVRKTTVAGQFYPDSKADLEQMIEYFMSNALQKQLPGTITALLSPHAGYIFSGGIAAYAYNQVKGKTYDTVIIIGLSHRYSLENIAAVYPKGKFETPLGYIEIDNILAEKIINKSNNLIKPLPAAHNNEHSIEVQLPFIQKVLPGTKIVPILIGNPGTDISSQIGTAIGEAVKEEKKRVLLIGSTDMSHYPKYEDAQTVDTGVLKALESFDINQINSYIRSVETKNIPNLHCVFCGEGVVYAITTASKVLGADTIKILTYANSGDVPKYGNKDSVVGYTAAVYLKSGKKNIINKGAQPVMKKEFSVSVEAQTELLRLARESITQALDNKQMKYTPKLDELKNQAAVFVTLRTGTGLRGCIGTTTPQEELYKAVIHMAQAAAFEDTRFTPVTKDELTKISIEISVLSPLKQSAVDDIIPNKTGVLVRKGMRGGLYLPQVWDETGWNTEQFMSSLCAHKAGLPPDAWKKDGTDIYTFTVFPFEEHGK